MYALASLGLRRSAGGFCVAGVALGALQRVAGAALGALQGVGCTPWCPLVSAALPVAFAWQARHLVLCKGSDVRSGVPWSPVAFAWQARRPLVSAALPVAFAWQARYLVLCKWQARHLVLCKGSDLHPGVPWSPVAFAWQAQHFRGLCVAGAALGALQGVGCTPWRPLVSGGFCVAGAALGALQGVGCTPWRPLVSAALPLGFAWQARHLVLCKASDVRPGVPWSPVAFAWQARHLVLCKGSDVRPGVPWSPPLCRWLLRGRRGTWCSARGRILLLLSGILEFFWALFFFKVRGVAGAAKNENQK